MIIEINDTNKELFVTVAPNMMLNFISVERTYAYGDYLEAEDGTLTATGIIIYSIFNDKAHIIWHFVDEKFRGSGIGEALVNKVLVQNDEKVNILFPVKYMTAEYLPQISRYYEDLGFVHGDEDLAPFSAFVFLSQKKSFYSFLAKITITNARPLSAFSNKDLAKYLSALPMLSRNASHILNSNFLDRDLSCTTGSNGKITSALFAVDAEGTIDVLSIVNLDKNLPINVLKLLAYFITELNNRYPDGIRVQVLTPRPLSKQADALRVLFPDIKEEIPHIMVFEESDS